jgi:dCMP deaminase
MEISQDKLTEICSAVVALEKAGKKFLVDYGYSNAVEVAKKLGLFILQEEKSIETPSWDEVFMREVYLWASKSKDPRTKIGAVLVKDNIPISHGYNGFARGVDDCFGRYDSRNIKYDFIVHAEANSVLNCARRGISSIGSTLYTQGIPCHKCADDIIQGGIKEIVIHKQWPQMIAKWQESIKTSEVKFEETKIKIRVFDKVLDIKGFNDEKIINV